MGIISLPKSRSNKNCSMDWKNICHLPYCYHHPPAHWLKPWTGHEHDLVTSLTNQLNVVLSLWEGSKCLLTLATRLWTDLHCWCIFVMGVWRWQPAQPVGINMLLCECDVGLTNCGPILVKTPPVPCGFPQANEVAFIYFYKLQSFYTIHICVYSRYHVVL